MNKKLLIFWIIVIISIICLCNYSKNKNKPTEISDLSKISQTKGPVDLSKNVVVEENHSEKFADGGRLNTSTKLKEEKIFNGLKFSNISLSKQNGNTMLLADIQNNSGQDIASGQKITIVFKDSTGNYIEEVEGLLPAVKTGAKGQLNLNIATGSDNIVNAYDFEVKEAK